MTALPALDDGSHDLVHLSPTRTSAMSSRDISLTRTTTTITWSRGCRRIVCQNAFPTETSRRRTGGRSRTDDDSKLGIGAKLWVTFTHREDPIDERSRKHWNVVYTRATAALVTEEGPVNAAAGDIAQAPFAASPPAQLPVQAAAPVAAPATTASREAHARAACRRPRPRNRPRRRLPDLARRLLIDGKTRPAGVNEPPGADSPMDARDRKSSTSVEAYLPRPGHPHTTSSTDGREALAFAISALTRATANLWIPNRARQTSAMDVAPMRSRAVLSRLPSSMNRRIASATTAIEHSPATAVTTSETRIHRSAFAVRSVAMWSSTSRWTCTSSSRRAGPSGSFVASSACAASLDIRRPVAVVNHPAVAAVVTTDTASENTVFHMSGTVAVRPATPKGNL